MRGLHRTDTPPSHLRTDERMLSAEHYALENEVVRNVLQIKQHEIQFYLDRFNSIATQSALIAGFLVSSIASLDTAKFHQNDTLKWLELPFLYAGSLAIVFALNSILCCTFAGIWGPSLALRGPNGSVTKAYHGLRKESRVVMASFGLTIFFFTVHICAALFAVDYQNKDDKGFHPLFCAIIVALGMGLSVMHLLKLRVGFKFNRGTYDEFNPENTIISDGEMENITESSSAKKGLLQNELASSAHVRRDDAMTTRTRERLSGIFQCEGFLEKRGRRSSSIFRGLVNNWAERYFLLQGTKMYGFRDSSACETFLESRDRSCFKDVKTISLIGYEVMVDSRQFSQTPTSNGTGYSNHFSFSLRRMAPGRNSKHDREERDRYFRTKSKEELDMWVKALVMASLNAEE